MDLAVEMARMKAERAARQAAASSSGAKNKYVRRGDARAAEQREAHVEETGVDDDGGRGAIAGTKRGREDEGTFARGADAVAAETTIARVLEDAEADEAMNALTVEETIRRLRSLGQPATLFGENREDRILRLKVATNNISIEDETTTTATQVNEKLLDAEHVEAFARKKKELAAAAAAAKAKGESGKDEEPEDEAAVEQKALLDSFAKAAAKIKKQRAAEDAEPIDQVAVYLKMLVSEWEAEIDAKSEAWCYTTEGRQTISTFQTTKQHLKPLFKRIKRRLLPGDLERALYLIMQAMKQRNYKKAMDAYVGIAIGNAAWPIGVTMVGIHARSAREKIGAQSQAHAMHDEETRKFLQSIKRLMTYAQRAYPTTPSLSLNFNSGINGSDKEELLKAEARLGPIDKSVPALMLGDGKDRGNSDGWRAQDSDTRTWKSMLTHAFGEKGRNAQITTAKDAVVARDTSLYSTRSGYVTADKSKKKPADDR